MLTPESRDAQSGVEEVLAGVLADLHGVAYASWDAYAAAILAHPAMQAAALGPLIAAARAEALREAADLLHKEARWQAEMATREPAGTHRRFAAQTIAARMAMHERILRERADREQAGHQDAQDGPGAASRGEVGGNASGALEGAQGGDYEASP